jgi:hypothetical protein
VGASFQLNRGRKAYGLVKRKNVAKNIRTEKGVKIALNADLEYQRTDLKFPFTSNMPLCCYLLQVQ